MKPAQGMDEALLFFLDVAALRGGAWEQTGDTAVVLLPDALRQELDLADEVTVTADPEAAREDGALLLARGHPVVEESARALLAIGDVGWSHLAWPRSALPRGAELVNHARGSIAVDHGRIDGTGQMPVEGYLPAVRVGVLIAYAASLEDRFQEQEEVWADGLTGLPLPEAVCRQLATQIAEPGRDPVRPMGGFDLEAAVHRAHARIEERAVARCQELAHHGLRARDEELARVAAYYDAALASISARAASAAPERLQLLAAQADATRLERSRRLAEIEEKYEAHHEVRPFRLHLVGLPALILPVHVRRGSRTFPLTLRWVLGARTFGPIACPHCGSDDVLVAGRERLGCRTCLPKAVAVSEPAPGDALDRPSAPSSRPEGEPTTPAGSGPTPAAGPSRAGPPPRARGPSAAALGHAPASRSRALAAVPEHRVIRLGEKLCDSFWDHVIEGERWRRKDIVMHSPMAALARLYGWEGPLRAIGLPQDASPRSMTSTGSIPSATGPHLTFGWIRTDEGNAPWVLRWQTHEGRAVVGEVLPVVGDGNAIYTARALVARIADQLVAPPAPRVELDAVARQIWEEATAREGLNFVLRCLACWWEVAGSPGAEGHGVAAMAAGVIDHVRKRSGLKRSLVQPTLLDPEADQVAVAAKLVAAVAGPPRARPW